MSHNTAISSEISMGCALGMILSGISMGCALGMILSWAANHSILWAILHGILGWIYVIYYVITKS